MANGMARGLVRGSGQGGRRRRRGAVKRAGRASPPRSILRGDLDNVGLATLLTILDLERRSGTVVVERQKLLGRLQVRDGRVVRARIDGGRRAPSTGADAIFQMLGWNEGHFELWQAAQTSGDSKRPTTPVDREQRSTSVDREEDEVGESTTFLLIEAARRADEAAGIVHAPSTAMAASADAF
jgi:uncharacterized protein DUF4388